MLVASGKVSPIYVPSFNHPILTFCRPLPPLLADQTGCSSVNCRFRSGSFLSCATWLVTNPVLRAPSPATRLQPRPHQLRDRLQRSPSRSRPLTQIQRRRTQFYPNPSKPGSHLAQPPCLINHRVSSPPPCPPATSTPLSSINLLTGDPVRTTLVCVLTLCL